MGFGRGLCAGEPIAARIVNWVLITCGLKDLLTLDIRHNPVCPERAELACGVAGSAPGVGVREADVVLVVIFFVDDVGESNLFDVGEIDCALGGLFGAGECGEEDCGDDGDYGDDDEELYEGESFMNW